MFAVSGIDYRRHFLKPKDFSKEGRYDADTIKTSRRRLPRAAGREQMAKCGPQIAHSYLNPFGNFIWALAKKITSSPEEMETAAKEIFIDIWLYAERSEKDRSPESLLKSMIARRRLIEYLQ